MTVSRRAVIAGAGVSAAAAAAAVAGGASAAPNDQGQTGIEEHGSAPAPFEAGRAVVVSILLYDGMTALDAVGPYELLNYVPGVTMQFVSEDGAPVRMDSGLLRLPATHSFATAKPADVLLVPGGPSADDTGRRTVLRDWVSRTSGRATWTVSVCTGALILAHAGLLAGRPATTHWIAMDLLGSLGAKPRPEARIVRSDQFVSAAGVSAGLDCTLWLISRIRDRATAEAAQLSIEYDPQPPFRSGHYSTASETTRKTARTLLKGALKR